MSRRPARYALLLLAAALPVWCGAALAAPTLQPPDQPIHMNLTRKPVFFSHQSHFDALGGKVGQEALCAQCHHPVQGETAYLSCAHAGCHDNLDARDKGVHSYFVATHRPEKKPINSCRSCHRERAGADRAAQKRLVGCKSSACHPTE